MKRKKSVSRRVTQAEKWGRKEPASYPNKKTVATTAEDRISAVVYCAMCMAIYLLVCIILVLINHYDPKIIAKFKQFAYITNTIMGIVGYGLFSLTEGKKKWVHIGGVVCVLLIILVAPSHDSVAAPIDTMEPLSAVATEGTDAEKQHPEPVATVVPFPPAPSAIADEGWVGKDDEAITLSIAENAGRYFKLTESGQTSSQGKFSHEIALAVIREDARKQLGTASEPPATNGEYGRLTANANQIEENELIRAYKKIINDSNFSVEEKRTAVALLEHLDSQQAPATVLEMLNSIIASREQARSISARPDLLEILSSAYYMRGIYHLMAGQTVLSSEDFMAAIQLRWERIGLLKIVDGKPMDQSVYSAYLYYVGLYYRYLSLSYSTNANAAKECAILSAIYFELSAEHPASKNAEAHYYAGMMYHRVLYILPSDDSDDDLILAAATQYTAASEYYSVSEWCESILAYAWAYDTRFGTAVYDQVKEKMS